MCYGFLNSSTLLAVEVTGAVQYKEDINNDDYVNKNNNNNNNTQQFFIFKLACHKMSEVAASQAE
jgi:hypothetical protein